MDKIPAFINSAARNADEVIRVLCEDERFDVHDVDPEMLQRKLTEYVQQGAEKVVIAGGDGTLAAAAAVLAGKKTALAVVPSGTLNHFAGALGIPEKPGEALDVAAGNQTAKVAAGFVNKRLFLNTSAVGAYVDYVRIRERFEPFWGYVGASVLAAVHTFWTFPSVVVELEVNGRTRRFESPLVFVGVGERELRPPKLGARRRGGRDGFHLLAVRPTTRARLVRMVARMLTGGVRPWGGEDELQSFFVRGCTVTLPDATPRIAVDGELVRLASPFQYEYEADALNVVVPSNGEPVAAKKGTG